MIVGRTYETLRNGKVKHQKVPEGHGMAVVSHDQSWHICRGGSGPCEKSLCKTRVALTVFFAGRLIVWLDCSKLLTSLLQFHWNNL